MISGAQAIRKARAPVVELEPATEGKVPANLSAVRVRYPLHGQRPPDMQDRTQNPPLSGMITSPLVTHHTFDFTHKRDSPILVVISK
ncbi:hypothetical protein PoB_003169400 [Plakobranchus ocellatus]|uniref:Uncharacterized protein n=1 Tax=Plakobranchus ocellatus TaxID=259542 RepID=A0AAV4AG10_9GAST|nr:hypothetical protein PoB_003169400 [Plakobranchus ocellatus]